jgi:hypothetical protein
MSIAPLFESDAEALIAAQSTYEDFLDLTDAIGAAGGAGSDQLYEVSLPEVADVEREGFDRFLDQGLRMTGESTLEVFELQYFVEPATEAEPTVAAYACVSVAGVDVVDGSGLSVVSATRPDLTAFEVGFVASDESETKLKVARNTVWAGDGVC